MASHAVILASFAERVSSKHSWKSFRDVKLDLVRTSDGKVAWLGVPHAFLYRITAPSGAYVSQSPSQESFVPTAPGVWTVEALNSFHRVLVSSSITI